MIIYTVGLRTDTTFKLKPKGRAWANAKNLFRGFLFYSISKMCKIQGCHILLTAYAARVFSQKQNKTKPKTSAYLFSVFSPSSGKNS